MPLYCPQEFQPGMVQRFHNSVRRFSHYFESRGNGMNRLMMVAVYCDPGLMQKVIQGCLFPYYDSMYRSVIRRGLMMLHSGWMLDRQILV